MDFLQECESRELITNIDAEIEDLISQVLCSETISEYDEQSYERQKKILKDLYDQVWSYTKQSDNLFFTITLEEILEMVMEHNMEIISELAAIEMNDEEQLSSYSHADCLDLFIGDYEDYEDPTDARYCACIDAWEEELLLHNGIPLDSIIMKMLNKIGLWYQIGQEDFDSCYGGVINSDIDVSIEVNDCQNVLFGETIFSTVPSNVRNRFTEDDFEQFKKVRIYTS